MKRMQKKEKKDANNFAKYFYCIEKIKNCGAGS